MKIKIGEPYFCEVFALTKKEVYTNMCSIDNINSFFVVTWNFQLNLMTRIHYPEL